MFKIVIHLLVTTLLVSFAGQLLKTGQTLSYDTDGNEITDGSVKDDGFYQMGADRDYTRNGDVVIDNVTGLEWQDNEKVRKLWLSDANYETCEHNNSSPACYDTSGDTATTYCSDLALDGGGWRLPSIEELETLLDDGKYDPSLTDGIFKNFSSSYYLSSTSNANNALNVWRVDFNNGFSNDYDKAYSQYVRCVRGGQ